MCKKIRSIIVLAIAATYPVVAGEITDTSLKSAISAVLEQAKPYRLEVGKFSVQHLEADDTIRTVTVDVSNNFGYIPNLDKKMIGRLSRDVQGKLGPDYKDYRVSFTIAGRPVEEFYPDAPLYYTIPRKHASFVSEVDELRHPKRGLDGKIIAMWQSHGWYYQQKENRWQWQRARIFETVEDLYTQSYVMPFLMPMLENAGAYVMSPRERDVNTVELIVDNDGGHADRSGYRETGAWTDGLGKGFGYVNKQLEGMENPFREGTYRTLTTVKGKAAGNAEWTASVPEDGQYAVYVSYATLPESTSDARYTVHTAGGDREFRVNQQMGGGTWVYLGHFHLTKGRHAIVTLSNRSSKKGTILTADAVKIGGGYGNVARKVSDATTEEEKEESFRRVNSRYTVSGYPRFTEAARYWMQWAGVPDSVYSPLNGKNDYNDDYRSRGLWVNYLAGGSNVLPDRKGLNIPVDMSFAFHSDAGTTMNDSIIGTLGIYFSNRGGIYENGTSRMNSRLLTNYVMTNIVNDIRAEYEPNWSRRGMWDASYFEARVPEVPAMLLELLSHQNFADMRYGLDPAFRFTVSRAIYKGIVEYFANRDGVKNYAIQPLPVRRFAIGKIGDGEYRLTWEATPDTLCDRATPTRYVVYERIGDGGFRKVAVTKNPLYTVKINDHSIHSYCIVAANDGGLSFPSEILALGEAEHSKGDVIVVNGFTRISGPDSFVVGDIAGFWSERDNGVPYMQDISYIGPMFEFRRRLPWTSDDSAGFGASRAMYEDDVIAGNTFDYPYIHGKSIMNAGYSFVSSSVAAVESGQVALERFAAVDLLLGKQKEIKIGRGEKPNRYAIYSPELRRAVTDYCNRGGNVLVTGAYVATDVWDNPGSTDEKRDFASKVLGYQWRVGQASMEGKAVTVPAYYPAFKPLSMDFYSQPNGKMYVVESPDAMYPTDNNIGCTILRYTENNIAAGVANAFDCYKTCVIGFPFETIKQGSARDELMRQVLEFFTTENNNK